MDQIERILNENHDKYVEKMRRRKMQKKNIKTQPKKVTNKKYKNTGKRIKALIAAGIIVLGVGTSSYVIGHNKGYDKGFEEATTYSTITEEDISNRIKDTLVTEYATAAGVKKEEVKIDYDKIDSKSSKTTVGDSKNTFEYNEDLGSFSTGNLKAKGYRNLIDKYINAINNGADKRKLINLLKETEKFSKANDLKVDGDTLKEVKVKDDDEGR